MAILDYTPIVGKTQLQSLILTLYSDSRTIFREYIQNACDSIYDAVSKGVLESENQGHVAVNINSYARYITIRDNGTGIPKDKAVPTLMDIFHSGKDGINTAGQYGIGRLSGGGYCNQLIFRTSCIGEDIETELTIDVLLLKSILADDADDRCAEEVMQEICSVRYNSAKVDAHYMEVKLKDVTHATDIILNEDVVKDYIRDIAPIDYEVSFKQLVRQTVGDYADKFNKLRCIHVTVNESVDIKKRYGLTIKGTGDEIYKLRCFTLKDSKYGNIAWGWYAVTPFSVQIPSSDESVGVRLRKHNISFDTNLLNSFFKEERGNSYFYGEIFIDNEEILPNSGRQGLAAGEESEALVKCLKEYFKTLTSVYTIANRIKNALKKVSERLEKYQGELTPEQKLAASDFLQKENSNFIQIISKPSYSDEVKDVCEIYLEKYETELKSSVESLINPTPPKTPSKQGGLQLVPPVTEPSVDDEPIDIFTPADSTDRGTSNQGGETHKPTPQPTPAPSSPKAPVSNPANINIPSTQRKNSVDRLLQYGFSEAEVSLARRIFGFMNIACPKQNKALLEELQTKAIDSLIVNQNHK